MTLAGEKGHVELVSLLLSRLVNLHSTFPYPENIRDTRKMETVCLEGDGLEEVGRKGVVSLKN